MPKTNKRTMGKPNPKRAKQAQGQAPTAGKNEARRYQGIADAMAEQWSAFVLSTPATALTAPTAGNHTVQLMLNITQTAAA